MVKGDKYTVKLFDGSARRPKCSCPATAMCCHILAAMISIRCVWLSKKGPNIAEIRRNARKDADKNSGRKRPRTLDINEPRKRHKNVIKQML